MQKIFSFSRTILLLFLLVLGVGQGWAITSDKLTTMTTSGTVVTDIITFSTAKNDGTSAPAISSSQLRLYQNANADVATGARGGSITFTAATGYVIDKVTLNNADNNACANAPVAYQVNGTGSWLGSTNVAKGGTYNTGSNLGANTVEIACFGKTSSTRLYIVGITVEYRSTTGGGKKDATLFNSTTINLQPEAEGYLTAFMTIPNDYDGTIYYGSNDDDVIMVDANDGYYIAVAEGSTTIYATAAATSTYNEIYEEVTVNISAAPQKTLSSIAVTTQPTKITYTVGETLDLTGCVVTATYSDASTDDVTSSCTFDPANGAALNAEGNQAVSVSYNGKNTSFNVTVNAAQTPEPAGDGYVLTALADIAASDEVLVVWTKEGNSYALANDQGTSAAPTAVGVSIVNNVISTDATNISWKLTKNDGTFVLNPYGDNAKWLYCTNTNNGVRVGTGAAKNFQIESGYLYEDGTTDARYLGVYNSADIRCYTSINSNISGQTLAFYVKQTSQDPEKEVSRITVTGTPAALWTGDEFSHEGITVTAIYTDETEGDVTSNATYEGYDMATAGNQTVTVSFGGKQTTYPVTVNTIANTQGTAYNVARAKELIDAGKGLNQWVYVTGKVSQVDSYNSTYHSITYWISADGTTADQFEVYAGLKSNSQDDQFSAMEDIELGATVIVYGAIKLYTDYNDNSIYELDKNNYLVSYTPIVKQNPELSFASSSYDAVRGQAFNAPELVNEHNVSPITYTSSNTNVATVEENTGTVTIKGKGQTTITANFGGNMEYNAGSAEYTLNVTLPSHTINWYVNGNLAKTENVEEDAAVSAPEVEDIAGKAFTGWVTTSTVSADVTPSYANPTTAKGPQNYYAVFATLTGTPSSLTKLNGSYAFAAGDNIVIVAPVEIDENPAWIGLLQETVSTSYVNYFTLTSEITIDDIDSDKKFVTLSAGANSTWKLGDETNGYLYSSNSNNLAISTENSSTFTISWDNDKNAFIIKTGSRWLTSRSDLTGDNQYKYRLGGTGATPLGSGYFDLYKYVVGSGSYSDYTTTVETSGTVSFVATDGITKYATFSSNRAVEFGDDVTVYTVTVSDGTMSLNEASKQVPANVGVLLTCENTTAIYSYIASAASLGENMLYAASVNKATLTDHKFYKLAYENSDKENLGFYWGAANGVAFTSREGSAYLAVPTDQAGSNAPVRFVFNNMDTATDIENVISNDAVKFFENGVLYILRDGVRYNALGQMVK